MRETKIYGHRGSAGTHPENTLLGFQYAIKQGVDGIELDVHMTKDGEIVVIHDEQLNRTTDGTGWIKDLSLDEIKNYSAGAKFTHLPNYHEDWISERVPTLQEVLELLLPYDIELNIELKTSFEIYEGIEEKILSIVKQYGNGRKVVYSAFHLPSLIRLKKLDHTSEIAWLLHRNISNPLDFKETFSLEAFHVNKQIIFADAYEYKHLFKDIRVWTVNDMDETKRLLDLQVDTIMTDFPQKALLCRSERKSFV